MIVLTSDMKEVDFDTAVELMDDEIREKLHLKDEPWSEQTFITAYEIMHYKKYGKKFVI